MELITLNCPNCGGVIQRKIDQYFVRCPYCGSEVAFDGIKEEAQLNGYKMRINDLEQSENADRKNREDMLRWIKARNIFMIIMSIAHFLSFSIVGYQVSIDGDNWIGLGAIFFLISYGIYLFVNPFLAAIYPAYNALSKRTEKGGKVIMWLKLMAIGFGLQLLAVILAFALVEVLLRL